MIDGTNKKMRTPTRNEKTTISARVLKRHVGNTTGTILDMNFFFLDNRSAKMLRIQGIGYDVENHKKIHRGCSGPWIIDKHDKKDCGGRWKEKKKTFEAMKDVKKDMIGVRNVNVLIGEN